MSKYGQLATSGCVISWDPLAEWVTVLFDELKLAEIMAKGSISPTTALLAANVFQLGAGE